MVALGLKAVYSLDKINGWDLTDAIKVQDTYRFLYQHKPKVVAISPPCTIFSKLQVHGAQYIASLPRVPSDRFHRLAGPARPSETMTAKVCKCRVAQ